MKRKMAVWVAGCALAGSLPAARYEVWDMPEKGYVVFDVPKGDGTLEVTIDGEKVSAQEVSGAGVCVAAPTAAQRARSRAASVTVDVARSGTEPPRAGARVARVTVTNAAFRLAFDETINAGLPHRLVWASGKDAGRVTWGDRVFAHGRPVGHLMSGRGAEVRDFGEGPLFRQIRTSAEFAAGVKKDACAGAPRGTYDWLFFKEAPEWTGLVMNYSSRENAGWDQLQGGIFEAAWGVFDWVASDEAAGAKKTKLSRGKTNGPRVTGQSWSALVASNAFAAVYSPDTCQFTDANRKVDYIHGSYRVSYQQAWSGEETRRLALFRFGEAACPEAALAADAGPLGRPVGMRRLDRAADVDAPRAGEESVDVTGGSLRVRVGIQRDAKGARAEIRSVRDGERLVAAGPQPLFAVRLEDVETGKRTDVTSRAVWQTVRVERAGNDTRFVFERADGLRCAVSAVPCAAGIDWRFTGRTGTNARALAEVSVGALTFLSTGRGMRALYPGCMGEVKLSPCSSGVGVRGSYPSMHCVMPWEAVWDESGKRYFYVGAEDPKGGAKFVGMTGDSAEATVRLELTHRLAWDPWEAGRESVMSGAVAWRAGAGDWYEAALQYRDWARAHAAWYPEMGDAGRVSTPGWFKDLGFIVRTYREPEKALRDVKVCQDFLGVPVMAHWYVWYAHGQFDNDYPHYFPARKGFEESVRELHRTGGRAVVYTNGHLWDMLDRGIEDWRFSREGAYGACRKPDGSIYTEKYRSMETNGNPVVFAAMCPASRVWHRKVGDNCDLIVNGADLDGYYMDQVGAFATIDCRNPEHDHPFGGGSWWQEAYRSLLKDARARCKKPVFFATEGNAEHTFDQIDAFVCWNIPGGVDTAPAFEVCYSGAVTVYCRSYGNAKKDAREMRMKFANVLADGEQFGWLPVEYCTTDGVKEYLRACVRFRHATREWFTRGEMRRPPRLLDAVGEWNETWDIFGSKRAVRMPVVQTGARRLVRYAKDAAGKRVWTSGRTEGAFVYFTNFSFDEPARARVAWDWADLGIDPDKACFWRVDGEGNRTPLARADLDKPFDFPAGTCWGILLEPAR